MSYYVYIYLNPMKQGKFKYDNYEFEYEPFYVGKGKGDRLNSHIKNIDKINKHKQNTINKIIKNELLPIIFKIEENLQEVRAWELEKEIIKLIGRRCNNTGTLTNIHVGGIGGKTLDEPWNKGKSFDETYSIEKTKELKQQARERNIGKKLTEETKRKISEGNKGKFVSEETKKKMSKSSKGNNPSTVTKDKISKKLKKYYKTHPEVIKEISKRKTGVVMKQETKDKISQSLKGRPKPPRKYQPSSMVWYFINEHNEEIFSYIGNITKFLTENNLSIRKTKRFNNKQDCLDYNSTYHWKIYSTKIGI